MIRIDDAEVAVATWGSGAPDIVLLHDGLGSVAQWRSVPAGIAERTGRCVLAYDRPGHGRSTPVPTGPWPADWLSGETRLLGRLLSAVGAVEPLVVGHSDGGSIALIHAIGGGDARGVVALAAHSWVESAAVAEIARLRGVRDDVVRSLARYHDHPGAVFDAWSGAWVGAGFGTFDIRPELHRISIPTRIVQGNADEFATDAQAIETAAAIGPEASCELLPSVGHLMHHDDPDLVIELVAETWDRLTP